MGQKLELAAVIKALREELNTAKLAGEGHDIRFNVNNLEVEFQTVVEMEVGADLVGKIKFLVLDLEAKLSGKYKNAVTHKVKLNLTPVDAKKTPEEIAITGSNALQINDKA